MWIKREFLMIQVVWATVLVQSTVIQAEVTNDESKSKSEDNIANNSIGLEPRASDQSFVRDIIDRLHALDADIGKLMYNSTSMYAPSEQPVPSPERGGEKFTEILSDLDSLQDEIGGLVTNATRTRQYNMLVRLRPLNNILYRIRHNLHLIRNSLVAINTVSRLEKLGNNVLDSTLQAFMKPDATLHDELGDNGNYDINLDKPETEAPSASSSSPNILLKTSTEVITSQAPTTPSTTTTTTTTTTTAAPTTTTTMATTTTTTTTTKSPSTTRRSNQRASTRRSNTRQSQRRSTTNKPSTALE